MKNVALDDTSALKHDPEAVDATLDAAADRDVLSNNVALDLCAIADQEIRGAQLAFDLAEHLRGPVAFDFANDRHPGPDARIGSCSLHDGIRLRWGLINDRTPGLHHLVCGFDHFGGGAVVLFGYFSLEHVALPFASATHDARQKTRVTGLLPRGVQFQQVGAS